MTFNQWCSGKRFEPHSRLALEAIWVEMTERGADPIVAKHLLEDLLESFKEKRR